MCLRSGKNMYAVPAQIPQRSLIYGKHIRAFAGMQRTTWNSELYRAAQSGARCAAAASAMHVCGHAAG